MGLFAVSVYLSIFMVLGIEFKDLHVLKSQILYQVHSRVLTASIVGAHGCSHQTQAVLNDQQNNKHLRQKHDQRRHLMLTLGSLFKTHRWTCAFTNI